MQGRSLVRVTKNGEGADASLIIYPEGSDKRAANSRTYAKEKIEEINPGVYDVEVKLLGVSGGKSTHRFEGVVVHPGATTELAHDFGTGTLEVFASNNQEGWDATIRVVDPAAANKSVGSGRTYGKAKKIEMNAGIYDVTIKALVIKGLVTSKTIKGVEIKGGATTSLKENFESGQLSVKVQSGGELVDAVVNVKESTTGKGFSVGRTYTRPKSNPKIQAFVPGTYEMTVKALGEHKGKKKTITVEVRAGETTEQVIEF